MKALTIWLSFDEFTILRKAIISFVMSVRLSPWKNAATFERIFSKFDIWVFLKYLPKKFSFN